MKKLIGSTFFTMVIAAFATGLFSFPVFAAEETKTISSLKDVDRNDAYYDEEFDAYVIPMHYNGKDFEILTKEEIKAIKDSMIKIEDEKIIQDSSYNDDNLKPANYYEYYTFEPTEGVKKAIGEAVKVSPDFTGNANEPSVTQSFSFTTSHTFSEEVSTALAEQAIIAGCGFSWTKSATTETSFTQPLKEGESGYAAFEPYYNAITGTLTLRSNWDGVLSRVKATGFSVKTLAGGVPDGNMYFVFYK